MRQLMGNNIDILPVLVVYINDKKVCSGYFFELAFEIMLGVANVNTGFSIPPYGKLGGRIRTLNSPHA